MARQLPHSDQTYMRQALALARRGLGLVAPNPPVGCVLAREGRVVGRGWHRRCGDLHAEAMALQAAGAAARGATAYVTLMPCAHQGRQPPCADALVRAGVARVVVARPDPNPVAGGGREILERAGIPVAVGLLEDEARQVAAGFFKRLAAGRPRVLLKYAMTLDGRTATAAGDSRWISGAAARHWVHRRRGWADAVLVGSGTVLADDPALDVRGLSASRHGLPAPQPKRVVIDARGRTPPSARIFSAPGGPVVIICGTGTPAETRAAWAARGAAVEVFGTDGDGHVPLAAALARLAENHAVNDILCEGGAGLAGALLEAGLVDDLAVFIAPKLCGGAAAPGALGGTGIPRMADAVALADFRARRLGGDLLLTAAVPGAGP